MPPYTVGNVIAFLVLLVAAVLVILAVAHVAVAASVVLLLVMIGALAVAVPSGSRCSISGPPCAQGRAMTGYGNGLSLSATI